MKIAKATTTATRIGSKFVPRLLCASAGIICFLELGHFGVWNCYRLFGKSSRHGAVYLCVLDHTSWDVLPHSGSLLPSCFLLLEVYLFFLVTLMKPSSSISGAAFSLTTGARGGASSISTSPSLSSSSSPLSPDSQSVSWSSSSAFLNI